MTLDELVRLRDALAFEINTWDEILAMAKTRGIKEHARAARDHCSRQLGQIEAEHAFRLSRQGFRSEVGIAPGVDAAVSLPGADLNKGHSPSPRRAG